MKEYDLIPTNGRKSFYGKARVEIADDGAETLISYHSRIIRRNADGSYVRLFEETLTHTTATHVKSFCGMNKKEFEKLPVVAE